MAEATTPEARLSALLDLADHIARIRTSADLVHRSLFDPALDAAGKALAERIHAVAAEIVEPCPAPTAPREFKIGDKVRVVRITCGDGEVDQHDTGAIGEIVLCNASGDTAESCRARWSVKAGHRWGWHCDDELEHVD